MANHLHSSSGAAQSETISLSLRLSAHPHLLTPSVLYSSLSSTQPLLSRLSSNRLSRRNAFHRLTWLSPFLPFPFLSLSNLLALSLTPQSDSHLWLTLVNARYSCVVSHRERSMSSFIFHCSWVPELSSQTQEQPPADAALQAAFHYFSESLFFLIPLTHEERCFCRRTHVLLSPWPTYQEKKKA